MELLEGEEMEEREIHDNKKMQLMEEVEEYFESEELDARNLAILYEITGY